MKDVGTLEAKYKNMEPDNLMKAASEIAVKEFTTQNDEFKRIFERVCTEIQDNTNQENEARISELSERID